MELVFKKEIIKRYNLLEYGLVKDCAFYKLFQNDILLGQFFYSRYVSYFAYDDLDIKIETTKHFFRKWDYKIIDQKKSIEIGKYDMPSWISRRNYIGSLEFDGTTYRCQQMKPDIESKFFKRKTWGHYKIGLKNQNDIIIYKFQLEIPWFGGLDSAYKPFTGHIESNSENLFSIFAGLFLIEQLFEREKNYD